MCLLKLSLLSGFRRKEFRGKLAIAITANFINRHTEAESRVEEISGVAFIFNQKFFNDLNASKGISLENIVYYKVGQINFEQNGVSLNMNYESFLLRKLFVRGSPWFVYVMVCTTVLI